MKTTQLNTTLGGILIALATTAFPADLNVPEDYSTLQSAVDAASDGDTIHIAAGVYKGEDLGSMGTARINRKNNLTLVGQPGTILRAVPNMAAAIPGDINWRCVLFIHLSPSVVLKNLTFEGDQLGDQQERGMIGAYYLDSGGTVENCRFTGFRERVPGDKDCWGLRFVNDLDGAPRYDARVTGNTVEDCYGGISVFGAPDVISYDLFLQDNTVSGVGPTATSGDLRGIELAWRVTGSVLNNTVSGFSYIGEGAELPFGYGLIAAGAGWPNSLAPLDPVRIDGNTFQDNNLHMVVLQADDQCPIVNNRITGNAPTNRPVGLWVTGADVPVRGNDFRDLDEGIRLGGEDPEFGEVLGIATDILLKGNRFSDVANPINYQPQATAIETDNQVAPFPEPILNIARSVRLSWPDYNEDYLLECATHTEGPWSPVDATITVQNGEVMAFVHAESHQTFFRLLKP